jgi:subtilisin family serine protease
MKKLTIFAVACFLMNISFAQVSPGKYYIQFTDKDNSPYSIDNPQEYLSQRSIDRRAAHGIAIDMKDMPVNPQYIQGVRDEGATIINPTKWLNGVTVVAEPSVITAIQALPFVKNVRKSVSGPDTKFKDKEFFSREEIGVKPPIPVVLKGTSSLHYGSSLNQISMLKGDEMHELGFRGKGMIIGVLDAGFTRADEIAVFDSLWNNGQIIASYDFVDDAALSYSKHYHGTMVLSTMGGNLPGEMVGTAPDAQYILLRTEDGASEYLIEEYNWVSGAEYADSIGADVLNTSLGYSDFDDDSQDHTYEDMDGNTTIITIGADIAASRGMAVVNSAGNSGESSWFYITAPADGDSVFCIGAVDAQGIPAGFSSNGPTYDERVKPNVSAQGLGTYIAQPDGSFAYGNGTSFSSPIIAGMVACLWQANPEMNNMELFNAIEQNSSLAPDFDYKLGYGIPDFVAANNYLSVKDRDIADLFKGINIYPNPFNSSLSIEFTAEKAAMLNLSMADMTGRIVFSRSYPAVKGSNMIKMDEAGEIPSGIYFIRMESEGAVLNAKVIRQ